MVSFYQYLHLIKPYLPRQLFSASYFAQLKPIADDLPGILALSPFCFECRLNTPVRRPDLLVSMTKNNDGPALLSGKLKNHHFHSGLYHTTTWRRIRDFGEIWAMPPSTLFRGIDDVWLEFDLYENDMEFENPSLFFGPLLQLSKDEVATLGSDDFIELITTVYSCMKSTSPPPGMIDLLKRCILNLPHFRSLFQVGLVARNNSDSLRLCILLPSDLYCLKKFLRKIRWPGNIAALDPMLRDLLPFNDCIGLHLDVSDQLSSKIGIELRSEEPGRRQSTWSELLKALHLTGHCLKENRDAVLEFPGYFAVGPGQCSEALGHAIGTDEHVSSFFVRRIMHLKLIFDGHSHDGWEAKAYLCILHAWKNMLDELHVGRWNRDIG